MQNILLITGKKQSGKSSLCNFIVGHVLQKHGVIHSYNLTENGDLEVPTDVHGNWGILDLWQRSPEFYQYAADNIYPYVHPYSFAEPLKRIAIDLFNLTEEQCYGTDEDKNSYTDIRWSDIAFALPPRTVGELKKKDKYNEFLTAREFLENFGTNICRKIYDYCWTDKCLADVKRHNSPLAIICDGRFPNEITRSLEFGAKTIRLGRDIFGSKADAEVALDGWGKDQYDLYVDNQNMTIDEKNNYVLSALIKWGIL